MLNEVEELQRQIRILQEVDKAQQAALSAMQKQIQVNTKYIKKLMQLGAS